MPITANPEHDNTNWLAAHSLLCQLMQATPCQEEQLIRQSESILDWNDFLVQLRWHRIASLIWPKIQKISHCIPEFVYMQIQQEHQKTALLSLKHAAALQQIAKLFEANDIRYLCLKGPALSQYLYGNYSTRFSRDLDIIVADFQLEHAINCLNKIGFVRISNTQLNSPVQRFAEQFLCKDISLRHKQLNVTLELHWRWEINPYLLQLPFDYAWENREYVEIADTRIATLNSQANLLYLCAHGAKSYWARLSWLADIDQILTHKRLNWEEMDTFAKSIKAERLLIYGMQLSNQLVATPIPLTLKTTLISKLLVKIGRKANEQAAYPGRFLYHALKLPLAPSWKYRWNWYTRFAGLNIDDVRLINLPLFLFPAYYFLRPALWTVRYITGRIAPSEHR